jgi:hypothetical protein
MINNQSGQHPALDTITRITTAMACVREARGSPTVAKLAVSGHLDMAWAGQTSMVTDRQLRLKLRLDGMSAALRREYESGAHTLMPVIL